MKTSKKLWLWLIILILLCPIGIILPEALKAGEAWGEWGADEIEKMIGYIPQGLQKLSELWSSPIPDYAFPGWEEGIKGYIAYIISGIIGVAVVGGITFLFGRLLIKKNGNP